MKVKHLTVSPFLAESNLYKSFYKDARKVSQALHALQHHTLSEGQQLSARQIDDIFKSVASGAAQGQNTADGTVDPSSNRTFLGKATDAVAGLKKKYDGLWKWIENTGPVQGFDTAFDSIQGDILKALGGNDSKTSNALQKYRAFAQKHPVLQGFILAGVGAMAAVAVGATGPAALAGVGLGIKTIDGLLKGDKASQALKRGVTGAAIGYTAGQVLNAITNIVPPVHADDVVPNAPVRPDYHDPVYNPPSDGPLLDPNVTPPGPVNPPPDVVAPATDLPSSVVAAKGDTLSQIAQANQTSVKALMQANPQITNPDALLPGTEINLPPINSTTYMGGVGTAADTAAKTASGQYMDVPSALAYQRGALGMRENKNPWIDREATVRSWYLNESVGKPRGRSVMLTAAGVNKIFEQVTIRKYLLEAEGEEEAKKPGLLSRIGSGLKAVGGSIGKALKKGANAATNKISYDKLGMEWRKIDPNRVIKSPDEMIADSSTVELFLRNQGVQDSLIRSVFKSMNIPTDLLGSSEEEQGQQQDQQQGQQGQGQGQQGKNRELFGREVDGSDSEEPAQTGTQASGNAGLSAIGRMAADLQSPQTSSTGGTTTTTATGTKHQASANNPNQAQAQAQGGVQGGGAQQGGAQQGAKGGTTTSNPYAYDYKTAAKLAGITPAQQKTPDYSRTMSGYKNQKITMKPPVAPKSTAPATAQANSDTIDFPSEQDLAALSTDHETMKEQRRVYGGKYVRESLDERLLKEFEFFVKNC